MQLFFRLSPAHPPGWKTYRHTGDSRPHCPGQSCQRHKQHCTGSDQCQPDIPSVSCGMDIKLPEQIKECPAVWSVLLIFIKYDHTENHSDQQPFHSADIHLACYVISLEQKIPQYKSRMIIHDHIMTSKDHQK